MKNLQTLINEVTPEQIARCHREETISGGHYYRVESENSDAIYETRFIAGQGFTCTCPAGANGFTNCSHGTCKHCRWAWKAEDVRTARIARLEALGLTAAEAQTAADADVKVSGESADDLTLARVYGVQPARPTEAEMNRMARTIEHRPFSFMR